MGFFSLLILLILSLFRATLSQSHSFNHTDMQAAIGDMRSQSFYGFALVLQMYLNNNSTTQHQLLNEDSLTFFMPVDRELSKYSLSPDHLEDFLLSHSMKMTLLFSDLIHFPTGTIVPSGLHDRMIKIQNHGRSDFSVNNAQVTAPNVCINSSMIKCHGIDLVISYENDDNSNTAQVGKSPGNAAGKPPPKAKPLSPRPKSFINGHH